MIGMPRTRSLAPRLLCATTLWRMAARLFGLSILASLALALVVAFAPYAIPWRWEESWNADYFSPHHLHDLAVSGVEMLVQLLLLSGLVAATLLRVIPRHHTKAGFWPLLFLMLPPQAYGLFATIEIAVALPAPDSVFSSIPLVASLTQILPTACFAFAVLRFAPPTSPAPKFAARQEPRDGAARTMRLLSSFLAASGLAALFFATRLIVGFQLVTFLGHRPDLATLEYTFVELTLPVPSIYMPVLFYWLSVFVAFCVAFTTRSLGRRGRPAAPPPPEEIQI